jgi:small subunit ribosomal protein S16
MGRKNRPYYRIGAYDNRTRRDGKAIEFLGTYDPLNPDPEKQYSLDAERVAHWVSVGAQPSETVRSLMRKSGVAMPAKKAKKSKKKA